ncbi:PTS transporter subunit IIC [Staphylococcus aureus]
MKTILGFLILSAGADVVVRSLEPFGKIFQHAFGVQGIVPNNEAIVSLALKDFWNNSCTHHGLWHDC